MITQEEVYERARQMAARARLPVADMLSDAEIELNAERSHALQAAAARAEAAAPPRDVLADRDYDEYLRRSAAQLDAATDPQRVATNARTRQRIEAQMRPLVAQRDELSRQIAALDAQRDELSRQIAALDAAWREHL